MTNLVQYTFYPHRVNSWGGGGGGGGGTFDLENGID